MHYAPPCRPFVLSTLCEAQRGTAAPLDAATSAAGGSGEDGGAAWSDAHVALLQSHLDSNAALSQEQLQVLLSALAAAVQQPAMAGSSKLCQLMMALATKHGAMMAPHQVRAQG